MLSILSQSYGDLAVRIYDNASGDDTEEVARELMRLDRRVDYCRHPQNIGGLQNMIAGMARVETPYFNILCDDDLLMPGFLATCAGIHDRAAAPAAFVSARVVVVDSASRIEEPYAHPGKRLSLAAPEGVLPCLTAGLSLPGVVYRTAAMTAIGPPRTAWWNWTESGWHALAAMACPIEFSGEIGAIVFVHHGSASKQMDGAEFRVSWFRMLAELRAAARRDAATERWWRRHVQPLAYSRFFGTTTRLCRRDSAGHYTALAALAVAAGLNRAVVRSLVAVARAAAVLGAGGLLNGLFDAVRGDAPASGVRAPAGGRDEAGLRHAAHVWTQLNRQAGLG